MILRIDTHIDICGVEARAEVELDYNADEPDVEILGVDLFDGERALDAPQWLQTAVSEQIYETQLDSLLHKARESALNEHFGMRTP